MGITAIRFLFCWHGLFYCGCIFTVNAQVPVNLSGLNKKQGVTVTQQKNTLLVSWPTGTTEKGRLVLDLQAENPLFKSIRCKRTVR
ncbi:MAG: hypothetical protein JWQ14_3483 [Adhaeribacter sp.]|nr:hypothetical protein [Adhaeribacter sp.]